MSSAPTLNPTLQHNIGVMFQYEVLKQKNMQPDLAVYNGRLFICSQKINTWCELITQLFLNVLRNLFYGKAFSYHEDDIEVPLDQVRAYYYFQTNYIMHRELRDLESKIEETKKELRELESKIEETKKESPEVQTKIEGAKGKLQKLKVKLLEALGQQSNS